MCPLVRRTAQSCQCTESPLNKSTTIFHGLYSYRQEKWSKNVQSSSETSLQSFEHFTSVIPLVHEGTVHGELLTSISVEVSGKIVCEKEETNSATIMSLSWYHSSRPIVTREITQLLLKSFLTVCIFKLKGKRDRLVLSWDLRRYVYFFSLQSLTETAHSFADGPHRSEKMKVTLQLSYIARLIYN